MERLLKRSFLIGLIGLAGCVTVPTGPSMMALPGSRKTFDEFRADDAWCRQYALEVAGVAPNQAIAQSGVVSSLVGTAIGAAAGAAFGGGSGAAIGAGAGLLVGAAAGTSAAWGSGVAVQQRYDFGYQQCMYAKGHRVPVSGRFAFSSPQASRASSSFFPPPPNSPPPPPPGSPPPPPPTN